MEMNMKDEFSVEAVLGDGKDAVIFNKVTEEIQKEEGEKLHGISEQADAWSSLAHLAVGATDQ